MNTASETTSLTTIGALLEKQLPTKLSDLRNHTSDVYHSLLQVIVDGNYARSLRDGFPLIPSFTIQKMDSSALAAWWRAVDKWFSAVAAETQTRIKAEGVIE